MTQGFTLKDSGRRTKFKGGAVRDTEEGKGRYDLVSPGALRRIARIYEAGAKKYAARNWEAGMPFSRLICSALRHAFQYLEGIRDEDHAAQAAWNLMAILHFEEAGRSGELNDLPWSKKPAPAAALAHAPELQASKLDMAIDRVHEALVRQQRRAEVMATIARAVDQLAAKPKRRRRSR